MAKTTKTYTTYLDYRDEEDSTIPKEILLLLEDYQQELDTQRWQRLKKFKRYLKYKLLGRYSCEPVLTCSTEVAFRDTKMGPWERLKSWLY